MSLLLATAAAIVATMAYIPFVRQRGASRVVVWLFCISAVCLSPCLVPVGAPERLISALVMACFMAKLFELFLSRGGPAQYSFWYYLSWLPNAYWLVLRRVPPEVPLRDDLMRVPVALAQSLLSLAAFAIVFSHGWSNFPFWIEHSVKAITAYAAAVSLMNLGAVCWRLSGGKAIDPMRSPWLAPTPAEFWRRWNLPAQSFFEEYGYRLFGGPRHPVRGIIAAFILSGIVHEQVFGVAAGKVQGVQLLFFLIEGAATIATARLRPAGVLLLPAVAMTIAFHLLTSVLFFQSVNAVVPFYSVRTP